jgi:hypothetical protein
MMANENLDTWKTTPAVINETVLAAKDFIEREIEKETWATVNKFIKSLFDDSRGFTNTQKQGVGQTTILKFLNGAENWKDGNWKQCYATPFDRKSTGDVSY